MSIETNDEARGFLQRVFACLFDAETPAAALSEFFAPDNQQEANGARLDFDEFIDHAQTIKSTIENASVEFEEIVVQGNLIADIHIVEARKKDGTAVRFQVIAFYRLRDGKITNVRELTHMMQGAEGDRDMGHCTSH
jgi:ketosteroid isomerase-like protein